MAHRDRGSQDGKAPVANGKARSESRSAERTPTREAERKLSCDGLSGERSEAPKPRSGDRIVAQGVSPGWPGIQTPQPRRGDTSFYKGTPSSRMVCRRYAAQAVWGGNLPRAYAPGYNSARRYAACSCGVKPIVCTNRRDQIANRRERRATPDRKMAERSAICGLAICFPPPGTLSAFCFPRFASEQCLLGGGGGG
jgi:hypothetical protein